MFGKKDSFWFAWYPVRLSCSSHWVWFRKVERIASRDFVGTYYSYFLYDEQGTLIN